MSEIKDKPTKRKKFHFWYIPAVILVLLIVGYVFLRINYKAEISKKLDSIKEQGYPVTLQELDDWYSIPDGVENAADYYAGAFLSYKQWDKQFLDQLPVVGKAQLPARTEPLTEETKRLMADYLSDNSEALALLHKAALIKHCRYPVNFNLGFGTLLTHPSKIREGCKLLQLEAILYADNNQPAGAIDSINAIFRLAASLEGEPLLVSHLVNIANKAIGISAIERVINRVPLSDEQLVSIGKILSDAYNPSGFSRVLAGEQCLGIDLLSSPGNQKLQGFSGSMPSNVLFDLYKAAGLSDKDLNLYLDFSSRYLEAAKLPENERCKAAKIIEEDFKAIPKIQVLVRIVSPAIKRVMELDVRHIARIRTAETGVAVQRYRLAHGRLPESLSQLVPQYFNAVPKDPFDGNDLRYKTLENGFVVYSINDDGNDDGGREQPKDTKDDSTFDITFISNLTH